MLKFDLYDGHGDPVAHLRGYCSKMRGAGGKDELLMAYFSQSLSGGALEWYTRQDASRWYTWDDMAKAFARHFQYNIDIVPDRLSLTKVEKRPSESFREYGFRWMNQAARVNPPMEEDEMVQYFLQALEPTYFGHLISAIGKSFNDVVKMGEMVEEGLKSSKMMSYSAIKATTVAIQGGTGSLLGKNKKDDVAMVVSGPWRGPRGSPHSYAQPRPQPQANTPAPYTPPQHYFPPQDPQNSARPPQYNVYHAQSYAQPPPYLQWRATIPQNTYPSLQPYQIPTGPNFRPRPKYRRERQQRKQTFTPLGESYASLFQRLRQLGVLRPIESKIPNPFPKNLDYSLRCAYCSDAPSPVKSNLVKVPDSTKAMPLTVEGVTEKLSSLYLKPSVLVVKGPSKDIGESQENPKVLPVVDNKTVPWNYKQVIVTYKGKEVEEEVNETGGLTHSVRCFAPEELRKAKAFKDSQIPLKKPVTEEEAEEFLKMMKVQDYFIVEHLRKTLAQISLLSLLIHSDEHRRALMKILNEAHVPDKITVNHLEKIANKIVEVNRITFSEDELPMERIEHNRALYLTVKCEHSIVLRVLFDTGSSANICSLSTRQKLNIRTERIHMNSVCVRGFDGGGKDSIGDIMIELSIGPVEFTMEFQVLDMAAEVDKGPWIYQLSKQSLLRRFLKENAFRGIMHPVRPRGNLGTFGLGFMTTEKDMKRVKPRTKKPPISSVPKPVVDVDEELIKRFQSLFDEINMVEVGEGSSKADVQLVGPNVKLSNWEATTLPARKEF
ncbi:PREDICTED: uncharacterized protein LOC109231668 [Nicotiana attenuata]|uniref:uncharacterized protein LOC109231668 n=1 Tax=Nicotiana attenuata TaxID=49451 RepID=UPI000904B8A5|nr:PREDICTED: uncharacterized protein LOC109231668 [Nicotiana attenuata]